MGELKVNPAFYGRYSYITMKNILPSKSLKCVKKNFLLEDSLLCLAFAGILSVGGCTKEEPIPNSVTPEKISTDKPDNAFGIVINDSTSNYEYSFSIKI